MNRTTATCIAGMRSKTTSRIRIHFQGRLDFHFFRFGLGIFAKRDCDGDRAQPVVMMGNWMLVTGFASLFAGDFSGNDS